MLWDVEITCSNSFCTSSLVVSAERADLPMQSIAVSSCMVALRCIFSQRGIKYLHSGCTLKEQSDV